MDTRGRKIIYGTGDFSHELAEDWGRPPEGYEFHQVAGVGVDSYDEVYLFNRPQIFSQDGEIQGIWTGLRQPADVAVGPQGETYVSELVHRISIPATGGDVLARWGEKSSDKPGQFVVPYGISINSRGDLYVGEVLEGRRIQKFIRRR